MAQCTYSRCPIEGCNRLGRKSRDTSWCLDTITQECMSTQYGICLIQASLYICKTTLCVKKSFKHATEKKILEKILWHAVHMFLPWPLEECWIQIALLPVTLQDAPVSHTKNVSNTIKCNIQWGQLFLRGTVSQERFCSILVKTAQVIDTRNLFANMKLLLEHQ